MTARVLNFPRTHTVIHASKIVDDLCKVQLSPHLASYPGLPVFCNIENTGRPGYKASPHPNCTRSDWLLVASICLSSEIKFTILTPLEDKCTFQQHFNQE